MECKTVFNQTMSFPFLTVIFLGLHLLLITQNLHNLYLDILNFILNQIIALDFEFCLWLPLLNFIFFVWSP